MEENRHKSPTKHRSESPDTSTTEKGYERGHHHYEKHGGNRIEHQDVPNARRGRKKKKRSKDNGSEAYENPIYDEANSLDDQQKLTDKKRKATKIIEDYTSPSAVEMNSINGSETQRSMMVTAREQGLLKSVRVGEDHNTDIQDLDEVDTAYLPQANSTVSPGILRGYNSYRYESAIKAFVSENIQHRQCRKYIRDTKKENGMCCCGRDVKWHEEQGMTISHAKTKEKWSWDHCTKTVKANAFGTIKFCGFGHDSEQHSPYIRVNHETDMENLENVWTLIHDYWHVPPPRLIISVTGGAKRFYLKNRLKHSFKRGLVNAATTTGAWIVTGGTNTGVMEFVGEAVKEYSMTQGVTEQPIVALGIATWGIIDNREALVGTANYGQFPTYYDAEDLQVKRGTAALDSNHSHFILVDDGTEGKFGKEINFRTAFEQYLSEKMETGVAKNQSIKIPVVLLVLEGGENTLRTAMSAIKMGTPVVVIQGSGRAADFIAKAMKDTKASITEPDGTDYPKDFKDKYKDHARIMFDWGRETDPQEKEKKISMCVSNLLDLLSHRSMITVFTLDDSETTNEIDQAILDALLTAKKSDLTTQLNLALAWNRSDVARDKILTVENRQKWQKNKDLLYEAMFTALVQDRVDFVQLFMDNGVELKKFLTISRLRDLYDDVVLENKYPSGCSQLVNHLLQNITMRGGGCCSRKVLVADQVPELLKLIGSVIAYLLGDQQDRMYEDDMYIIKENQSGEKKGTIGDRDVMKRRSTKFTKSDFDNPARELFLWAVLLNRRALALLFWKSGKDHIGAALIASALLKSLSSEAEKEVEIDLSTDLEDHAMVFQHYAVGVLNECYIKDKEMSHQLLVRELDLWGGTTLFALSDSAEQMEFMGHSCCQTKLNKIWNGKMALYTPSWKILASMFMPLFLFGIKFHDDPVGRSDDGLLQDDYEQASRDITGSPSNQITPHGGDESFFPSTKDERKIVRPEDIQRRKRKGHSSDRLHKVVCFGECNKQPGSFGFFQAMMYYYKSPVTKFYFHNLSYLVFLALYSFMVLVELSPMGMPQWPSVIEFIVWGWTVTLIMEEYRQVITKDPKSLKYKVSGYFSSIWNRFDQFVHFLFILSIILRVSLKDENFVWARMFYVITLIMYYLRFLQSFFMAKNLGPKVIMIKRMLTDLMFFLLILIVFIMAYGVAAQALRYPNSDPNWALLMDVVYQPYWNIYGELFLDELNGDVGPCVNGTSDDPDLPRCPEKNALVLILFAIYMILTMVLLLNLLIAMFSYTFERVQENSEKVWRYYRYSLIYEYFDRPTLAPPLIIINHIARFVKFIRRKCTDNMKISHDFKMVLDKDANQKLTAFERVGMENFLHKQGISAKDQIEAKVHTTGERIEKVIEDLESIKEQMGSGEDATVVEEKQNTPLAIEYPDGEEMTKMHRRINKLEGYLQQQQTQLDTALQLLQTLATQQQQPQNKGDSGGSGQLPLSQPAVSPYRASLPVIYGYQPHVGYQQPPIVPSSSGTFYMQAPPLPNTVPQPSSGASDSPYASIGGVPVSPTRRTSYKAFTSPQIEIDEFPQDHSDSHT